MPFGKYPDFAACIKAQMKKGYSKEAAGGICGLIEKRHKQKHNLSEDMDCKNAHKSLKEEKEAIVNYEKRIKEAKDGSLKKAFSHALEEERTHAKMFSDWIGKGAQKNILKDNETKRHYADSDECIADMMNRGHNEDDARMMCKAVEPRIREEKMKEKMSISELDELMHFLEDIDPNADIFSDWNFFKNKKISTNMK